MYCWTFVQDEDTYTIYINHNLKYMINNDNHDDNDFIMDNHNVNENVQYQ